MVKEWSRNVLLEGAWLSSHFFQFTPFHEAPVIFTPPPPQHAVLILRILRAFREAPGLAQGWASSLAPCHEIGEISCMLRIIDPVQHSLGQFIGAASCGVPVEHLVISTQVKQPHTGGGVWKS